MSTPEPTPADKAAAQEILDELFGPGDCMIPQWLEGVSGIIAKHMVGERKHVTQIREEAWNDLIAERGVQEACNKCSGLSVRAYPSTATWIGGVGGQVITSGVCDQCWGSGDKNRPWVNLRQLRNNPAAQKALEGKT